MGSSSGERGLHASLEPPVEGDKPLEIQLLLITVLLAQLDGFCLHPAPPELLGICTSRAGLKGLAQKR